MCIRDSNFTGGAAALSPTVTATWGDGGYFRISNNGTVEQSGVHLNAPTFKFYLPKAGSESALSLGFKMCIRDRDGINLSLDTLDAETFRQLTRRDGLDKALQALDLAAASNIPLKINCVPIQDVYKRQFLD